MCNQPKYICHNTDPDIDFRVYEETCYAMRAKQKHEEKKKDDKNREGIYVGTEAYTHSRTELTEFRGPYYVEQAEGRERRENARPVIPREHPPGWTPEDDGA